MFGTQERTLLLRCFFQQVGGHPSLLFQGVLMDRGSSVLGAVESGPCFGEEPPFASDSDMNIRLDR